MPPRQGRQQGCQVTQESHARQDSKKARRNLETELGFL